MTAMQLTVTAEWRKANPHVYTLDIGQYSARVFYLPERDIWQWSVAISGVHRVTETADDPWECQDDATRVIRKHHAGLL